MSDYWYTRPNGKQIKLGLIDNTGAYLAAAQTVIIECSETPTTIISEEDIIPVNDEFLLGVIKGVANEVLKIDAKPRPDYEFEFQKVLKSMRRRNTSAQMGNMKPKKVAVL